MDENKYCPPDDWTYEDETVRAWMVVERFALSRNTIRHIEANYFGKTPFPESPFDFDISTFIPCLIGKAVLIQITPNGFNLASSGEIKLANPMDEIEDQQSRDARRDIALVKSIASQLAEHFDSVRVICTKSRGDECAMTTWGDGSFYAQRDSVRTWLKKNS